MQNTITKEQILQYVRSNWFKLLLICLVAFIFLRKDLSLTFNLNSPLKVEEQKQHQEKIKTESGKKKPEILSENRQPKKESSSKGSIMERFYIPFIGKGKSSVRKKREIPLIDYKTKMEYVQRFSKVAVNERKKFGIPSSVILANALLNSFSGKRDMAILGNNHFAIPCTANWHGDSDTYNDACYRHYENAWASFRDHSFYLHQGKFKKLTSLSPTDYEGWVKGLEKAGFSDIEDYANEMIQIIEQMDLGQV